MHIKQVIVEGFKTYREQTAAEILRDFPEGLDVLITGVGTGGHSSDNVPLGLVGHVAGPGSKPPHIATGHRVNDDRKWCKWLRRWGHLAWRRNFCRNNALAAAL